MMRRNRHQRQAHEEAEQILVSEVFPAFDQALEGETVDWSRLEAHARAAKEIERAKGREWQFSTFIIILVTSPYPCLSALAQAPEYVDALLGLDQVRGGAGY